MPCRCATSCATGPDAASRGNPARLLHPPLALESGRLSAGIDIVLVTKGVAMPSLGYIVIYADDPPRPAHFWAGVFGYPHAELDGEVRDLPVAIGLPEPRKSARPGKT